MNSVNPDSQSKKNHQSSKKACESSSSPPVSTPPNSQLFIHTFKLLNFLKPIQVSNQSQLNLDDRKNINQLVFNVINDLSKVDFFPNIQINSVSTTNEVYYILSRALCIVVKDDNHTLENLLLKNQALRNEIFELQKKYSQILQSNSNFNDSTKFKNSLGDLDEIEKYNEIKKEVSNLIIYLKHHFDLSESTNLFNIIDAINIKCTCQISEKDRIEQLMMRNKDLEDRLMTLQKEKYEIDKKEANLPSFVLENEISALKNQLKKILQKYESKKAKAQSLAKTIIELKETINQLTRDLETSKINYDKLLIDLEDKKKQNENDNIISISKYDLQIKDDEITNLHSALNEVSIQLEKMNEDLRLEASMKNNLFNAFQIQNNIMNLIEDRFKEEEKKKKVKNDSAIHLKSSIIANMSIEEEEVENEGNIIHDLFLFLSSSNLEKAEIDKFDKILQNKESTVSSKITNILNTLITKISQKEKIILSKPQISNNEQKFLIDQNDRLKKYLSNLLYFIDQVTSSGEMQGFFIESNINYDFREKLMTQCSRIESFIKENGIDIDDDTYLEGNSNLTENFLDISHFFNYVEGQVCNPDSEEYLLLLRQFTFINESIRRFADEMKQQAEKYLSEIKQLRYQIIECQDQHTYELNKTIEALKNEIQKERTLKNAIDKIKSILHKAKTRDLRQDNKIQKEESKDSTEVEFEEEEEDFDSDDNSFKDKSNDFYILKCIKIIKDVDNLNFNINNLVHENEQGISRIDKLEQKLNNEIEKRKSIQTQARNKILKLKNKIKLLKKQSLLDKQKFIEEIDYAKKQFDDLSTSIIKSNNNSLNNNQPKIEIDEKNFLISSLNEKIQQKDEEIQKRDEEISKLKSLFDLEKEKILLDYQNQNQQIFKEKDDKITSLLLSLENSQSNSEVKVKEIKQDLKQIIKKLQNDVNLETERANNIRNHFEIIFKELKVKLHQSRESEKAAIEKVNNVENELKKAKSTISKLRIDVKMLNLKIVAAEDKLIREKSLFDSQLKMKILGLQTDNQDKINELREIYENKNHRFYMQICEIFKDFIDFNTTFSDDSLLNTLQQVSDTLNKANQKLIRKKSLLPLLNDIKSLLNVSNNNEIINALTKVISDANEYRDKSIIQNDQKKANLLLKKAKSTNNNDNSTRDWEIWAKRLYAMITDSFSNTKTVKQLQYAIEEALLSSIGQRQLWKKLEVLRKEKSILTSGVLNTQIDKSDLQDNSNQSMISLIAAYISIYRMQKLSGHLKFKVDFSPKKEDNC